MANRRRKQGVFAVGVNTVALNVKDEKIDGTHITFALETVFKSISFF